MEFWTGDDHLYLTENHYKYEVSQELQLDKDRIRSKIPFIHIYYVQYIYYINYY